MRPGDEQQTSLATGDAARSQRKRPPSRPGRRVPDRQCTATARNPSLWGDDPAVGRYRECADGVPRWELKARANSDHRRQLAGSDALVFTRGAVCSTSPQEEGKRGEHPPG